MYICECKREFTTPHGLGYHKKYCGKNNIFYDHDYECKIGQDGNIVYIHREVMEQKLGRKLIPGEVVHHIDENKRNNDPNNLELKNNSTHAKHHNPNGRIENLEPHWIKRGLRPKGNPKFTEEEILEIRDRLKQENVNDIANEYGVHRTTIASIKKKTSWSHI